jgi:acetolactate synthase-1/2/3 large subunit
VATLILPSDTSWDEGGAVAAPLAVPGPAPVDAGIIATVARVLRSGEPALLLLGGKALLETPLALAGGIAAATGARMLAETSNARIARGRGRMPIERVPYPVDLAIAALAGLKHIILVGSKAPVGFFAYPGKPGRMFPEDCTIHLLSRPDQDGPGALAALADALDAPPATPLAPRPPQTVRGAVTSEGMAHVLAALLPEGAVVVDESVSFGRGLFPLTHAAAPHDWLHLTGGAIGEGLPMSVGAAIAAPGSRVVTLQADGSAMYTVQALWTQAREKLDITTIILANRKYAILLGELAGVGANPGRTALDMLDLGNPALDWCHMARGMGVEAAKAETLEQFADLLGQSVKRRGPFLIELMI